MAKNSKNSNNSNINGRTRLIFCGLAAGYDGSSDLQPEEACIGVTLGLAKLGCTAEVFPGVCVYHTDWGCPVGGEAVGAFRLPAGPDALRVANQLRRELKQTTLSVAMQGIGEPTVGFTARISGKLKEVGAKWQELAAAEMAKTGIYVSVGMATDGETITVSAEANPAFIRDFESWKQVVKAICAEFGVAPEFGQTGLTYLR